MQHRMTNEGDTKTIYLSGRLSFSDNADFREIVHDLARHQGQDAIIDLSGLSFIDSAGLGLLILAHDTAKDHDIRLSLRGAADQVERLLSIAQISNLMGTGA